MRCLKQHSEEYLVAHILGSDSSPCCPKHHHAAFSFIRFRKAILSRAARISYAPPLYLCYLFRVAIEFHSILSYFRISPHKLFRLLKYTASYF